jgi:thioredoxin-like negative regulator of GroEL
MQRLARLLVLALAAAALVYPVAAAAGERFVPADANFVVANVKQAVPDAGLRELIARWRADPRDPATAALAAAFMERARTLREPMYMGRAEALLAPAVKRPAASPQTRRLYAETLQYRHDFAAAETLLDQILQADARDPVARLQRASIRLVRGNFAGARADCAVLVAGGGAGQAAALACLAESLAGSGQLAQARALLAALPQGDGVESRVRAYLLTVRGELQERSAEMAPALADYRAALALNPNDDSIRASLADMLLASGDRDGARAVLTVERPGVALLVRAAASATGAERAGLREQASAVLELERSRGDAPHLREAAMLALLDGDSRAALGAAEANFRVQRELPDVRVLARAAASARDAAALRRLDDWMHQTRFQDSFTESVLAHGSRG